VTRPPAPAHFDLERFFDYAIDMLCITDGSGHFLKVNRAFERVLGYSREELLARPFVEFVHPDDRVETLAETRRLSQGSICFAYENRYLSKDGAWKYISWTCYPDAETGLMYAVARDMTEQRAREDRLDGITGIPNRRVFDDALADEFRRAARLSLPLGVALLDVDHLRAYNERVGHLEGDRVLRQIADALGARLRRASDLLARYNGGTFGVLLADVREADAARGYCEQLRQSVASMDLGFQTTDGKRAVLTMSGGFAVSNPSRGDRPEPLVKTAQRALIRAKAQGRNRLESA
jgi:diguanylate cyclase (GGDEF)-like protein/PAS domain S-box-containing protein